MWPRKDSGCRPTKPNQTAVLAMGTQRRGFTSAWAYQNLVGASGLHICEFGGAPPNPQARWAGPLQRRRPSHCRCCAICWLRVGSVCERVGFTCRRDGLTVTWRRHASSARRQLSGGRMQAFDNPLSPDSAQCWLREGRMSASIVERRFWSWRTSGLSGTQGASGCEVRQDSLQRLANSVVRGLEACQYDDCARFIHACTDIYIHAHNCMHTYII